MDAEGFDQILRSRRSVRSYRSTPLTQSLLREAVDAARWAPTPHNAQPCRFVIITTTEGKRTLADAMAVRFNQDLLGDGLPNQEITARLERSKLRIGSAAAIIVACLTDEGLHRYPDARRQAAERTMAGQGLGAAVQNLLLTLHSRGLGACWMCAPLFCPETVRAALSLPLEWEPQAMITIGEPAETPTPPHRLDLERIVIYR